MKSMIEFHHFEMLTLIIKYGSFRKAAKALNISPPTLTITINNLEEKLGVRLLNRSTRSLSLTSIGEDFFNEMIPVFNDYRRVIDNLNYYREKPEGVVRVNLPRVVIDLFFKLYFVKFKKAYPDIKLELFASDTKVNIIDSGFDVGIRYSQDIPKDMIAIPLGGKLSLIPVASPDFINEFGKPSSPNDLVNFKCINRCFPSGKLYCWEFISPQGDAMAVSVKGDLVLDSDIAMIQAAEAGLGIGFVYENLVEESIKERKLIRLLSDFNYPTDNFNIYYPSRKHLPLALKAFITWVISMNKNILQ